MNAIINFLNQTKKNGCTLNLFVGFGPTYAFSCQKIVSSSIPSCRTRELESDDTLYFGTKKNKDLLLQSGQSTTAGMWNRDRLSNLVSCKSRTILNILDPMIYQCFLFKIMKWAESLNNCWIGPHQFNLAESLNNISTLNSFLSVSSFFFFFFQAHMFYLIVV